MKSKTILQPLIWPSIFSDYIIFEFPLPVLYKSIRSEYFEAMVYPIGTNSTYSIENLILLKI